MKNYFSSLKIKMFLCWVLVFLFLQCVRTKRRVWREMFFSVKMVVIKMKPPSPLGLNKSAAASLLLQIWWCNSVKALKTELLWFASEIKWEFGLGDQRTRHCRLRISWSEPSWRLRLRRRFMFTASSKRRGITAPIITALKQTSASFTWFNPSCWSVVTQTVGFPGATRRFLPLFFVASGSEYSNTFHPHPLLLLLFFFSFSYLWDFLRQWNKTEN